MWVIYELTPDKNGDDKRIVVIRDDEQDAKKVLKVLEETNIDFDTYQLEEVK